MVISRQLAHKLTNGLQMIVSATELGMPKQVIEKARELAQLINAHIESPEQQKAREEYESQ